MTLETGGSISGGLYRENAGLELPERHRVDLADFRHEQERDHRRDPVAAQQVEAAPNHARLELCEVCLKTLLQLELST